MHLCLFIKIPALELIDKFIYFQKLRLHPMLILWVGKHLFEPNSSRGTLHEIKESPSSDLIYT